MSKYANFFKSTSEDEQLPDKGRGEALARFTLLFVDDEENVLNALRRVFIEENYIILTAINGAEAISILEREQIHLVISDYMMPGMNGVDLLYRIKQRWPETIRIMLTGHADVQAIMGAVSNGAVYKFITKPWNDEDLRLTVSLAIQQYVLIQENKTLKEITNQQQAKIKNLSAFSNKDRKALGNMLVKLGVIKQEDLAKVQNNKKDGEFLTETMARLGMTTEAKIIKALQAHLNIEYVDIKEMHLNQG
ncbi:MAG: response regulator, partial [Desulfomonilia bacterium]